jgi:hypothetical protein
LLRDRATSDPDGYGRGAVLRAIASGWPDDPQTLPLLRDRAASDPSQYARGAALQAIATGWPEEVTDRSGQKPP